MFNSQHAKHLLPCATCTEGSIALCALQHGPEAQASTCYDCKPSMFPEEKLLICRCSAIPLAAMLAVTSCNML